MSNTLSAQELRDLQQTVDRLQTELASVQVQQQRIVSELQYVAGVLASGANAADRAQHRSESRGDA